MATTQKQTMEVSEADLEVSVFRQMFLSAFFSDTTTYKGAYKNMGAKDTHMYYINSNLQ